VVDSNRTACPDEHALALQSSENARKRLGSRGDRGGNLLLGELDLVGGSTPVALLQKTHEPFAHVAARQDVDLIPEESHLAHHGSQEIAAKCLVFQQSPDARDVNLDDARVLSRLGRDRVVVGLEKRDLREELTRAHHVEHRLTAVAVRSEEPHAACGEHVHRVGGFAHHQVEALAEQVVDAVKSGAMKKFVVMGGCDGRMKSREYFTDLAKELPHDTVIMTAGCAKYRYNKLDLGDIGGIPRVLDAGQCNDSYSIAAIALKLKEVFELDDINDLPVDFAIAWYEQKAVCVLLALLALGFKGVRLGPTLPAFVSENVKAKIIEAFELKVTSDVESDLAAIVG